MDNPVDYMRIGRRVRAARLNKGLSQAELARLIGCTNNYISHIESAQTKVSLSLLMNLSRVLEKDFEYFLLDTPYVSHNKVVDENIAGKLEQCNVHTLLAVSKILDALLDYQRASNTEQNVSKPDARVDAQ